MKILLQIDGRSLCHRRLSNSGSSCCFPTSPSWAPVTHKTSPGSRVTNVQEAPRKKGLRSEGFATVMNLLSFPQVSLLVVRTFRRCVVLDSLRDTREPSVQVCDILHTSCAVSAVECSSASCAVPDLCHLHLVWDRRSLRTSAQR